MQQITPGAESGPIDLPALLLIFQYSGSVVAGPAVNRQTAEDPQFFVAAKSVPEQVR